MHGHLEKLKKKYIYIYGEKHLSIGSSSVALPPPTHSFLFF